MSINQIEQTLDQKVEALVVSEAEALVAKNWPSLSGKADPIIVQAVKDADPEIQALTVKIVSILESELGTLESKLGSNVTAVIQNLAKKL